MLGFFAELGNMMILGAPANAAPALQTPWVSAVGAVTIDFVALINAAAADAASQVTVEVLAADDNAGTNPVAVQFQHLSYKLGDPGILASNGQSTFVSVKDGNNAGVLVDSWTTVLADGDKDIQLQVPVRQRMGQVGKKFYSLRVTTGGTARQVAFAALRCDEEYGAGGGQQSFLGN